MDEALRRLVHTRAGDACEYCRLSRLIMPGIYHVEHIVARQHRGPTRPDNLALACQHCNLHKGTNLTGIDPDTGQITRLFHPRTDTWADHFSWSGHLILGRTAVGRTTVAVLAMNAPDRLSVRAALMLEGLFPPPA